MQVRENLAGFEPASHEETHGMLVAWGVFIRTLSAHGPRLKTASMALHGLPLQDSASRSDVLTVEIEEAGERIERILVMTTSNDREVLMLKYINQMSLDRGASLRSVSRRMFEAELNQAIGRVSTLLGLLRGI